VNANQRLLVDTRSVDLAVKHQSVDLNGLEVFYRAAVSENAPNYCTASAAISQKSSPSC
jgi:hypothetical protein